MTLSVDGRQNLLPIWHEIDRAEVAAHSPSLADKFARNTSTTPTADIAEEIAALVLEVRNQQ